MKDIINTMNKFAPICFFAYNRLEETKNSIEALRQNFLAHKSDLYIFVDGPKTFKDQEKIQGVISFLSSIDGFNSIELYTSKTNQGLAASIISGVSSIIKKHGKVIVLEDDLVTSRNFLNFMNDALAFYSNTSKIFSISGYTMNLKTLQNYPSDFYLGYRASSWGWGTWENRWNKIDWEMGSYEKFKYNIVEQIKFARGGSDMPLMLHRQMKSKIDSWAIRWCYHQFKHDVLTVFPTKSKVLNIGFSESATHTRKTKRFLTKLDESEAEVFKFDERIEIDKGLSREFRLKFSLVARLKDKF